MSIKSSPLDWLSFPPTSPGDIHAPHPDLFELELDSSIIALPQDDQEQLQLLNIELSDPYAFVRSDTPRCGPPSTFTVSSESTYDSYSSHSESLYNYSNPPSGYDANGEFSVDLGIDFSKFSVDVDAAAAEAKVQLSVSGNVKDEPDNSLGLLPKVENDTVGSPNLFGISYTEGLAPAGAAHGNVTPQLSADYYASALFEKTLAAVQPTISPGNLLPRSVTAAPPHLEHMSPSPTSSSGNSRHSMEASDMSEHRDPRKKYKCPSCPRAFARAYNLKTHLQTHDPHRLKPHTCPYKSCGRSFSRKHDLGRHLVSIHRDESGNSSIDTEHKSIGVAQGVRGWCDDCGAGWVGKQATCSCQEVK